MTDEQQTDVIEHAVRAGRDPAWRRATTARLGAAAALFVVVGAVAVYFFVTTTSLRGETLALHGQVADLASRQSAAAVGEQRLAGQISALGATPVVTPATPVTGVPGPPGPGPTQAQIDAAVAGYFAEHPPGATPAMIAVQVAAFLTSNPPAPGRPPTQQEIATAAADYLSSHPGEFTGPTGEPGPAGSPGADATDAQVSSAVAAYCAAHAGCTGPTGATGAVGAAGAQGVSVTDLTFQRDSTGACQVVITLHDPATGADTTITHPAGEAACPLVHGNG